jgi:hypothetical protein
MQTMHPISDNTAVTEARAPFCRHYTVGELSSLWGFGRTTVRRWLENEPGVLRHGESRPRRDRKNAYVSLRIPEGVALRVYRRHTEKV